MQNDLNAPFKIITRIMNPPLKNVMGDTTVLILQWKL